MKAVTSKVKDMAKEKNTWVENKSVWDYEKVMKKWDSISPVQGDVVSNKA